MLVMEIYSDKTVRKLKKFAYDEKNFHMQILSNIQDHDYEFYRLQSLRYNILKKAEHEINLEGKPLFSLINLFHLTFPHKNIPNFKRVEFDELYIYTLFIIVCKIENPDILPIIREIMMEKNILNDEIAELEIYLLNKINWKIQLITINDIMVNIFNDFKKHDKYFLIKEDFYNTCNELITFSISNNIIYCSYDQFTILNACLLIAMEVGEKYIIFQEHQNFLSKKLDNLIDECLLENCKNKIIQIYTMDIQEKCDISLDKNLFANVSNDNISLDIENLSTSEINETFYEHLIVNEINFQNLNENKFGFKNQNDDLFI